MGDKRRNTAVGRATGLEKGLARLSITLAPSAPADAVVKRDGVTLGAASLGLATPVDPGRHVVLVAAAGHESRETEVVLRAKEQKSIVVEAGAEGAPPATAADTKPSPSTTGKSSTESDTHTASVSLERRTPIVSYALLGVGALGIGAGTYFGLAALGARKDASALCPDVGGVRRCTAAASGPLDRDKRYSLFADISIGVGVVAAGAGLYMLLKPQHAEPATTAGFMPLPGGGEVQVAGRF